MKREGRPRARPHALVVRNDPFVSDAATAAPGDDDETRLASNSADAIERLCGGGVDPERSLWADAVSRHSQRPTQSVCPQVNTNRDRRAPKGLFIRCALARPC